MFYSHKKRLVFQDNCINQQNTDLQTKNDLKKNNCQLKELTERKDKNEDNLKSITNDKTVNSSSISNIQKDPNLVFQCIDCQQMFTTPNLLADHVFSDHKKVLLLQVIPSCDQQISMKTTDTSQPIRRNININSINDKNNDQLDKQRVIRSKPGGYKCLNSDCQQTMRTLKQYRKHLSICMITCPQCHKKYKSQKSYDYHQLAAHGSGSETMYKCDYIGCNYQSVSPRSVKTHKNRYHTDRTFVCNIDGCGKSFKTNGALKYHRESHSKLEIYVCDADGCSKAFKHNSHYKRHLAEHRSEPTLKCPEKDCRRFFYTDRDIYRHRIDDHKRKVKKNLIRPYKRCDWPGCDYYGIELIRHSRVHTGEKNFHCDWPECGKRFSEKQKLNHHMNIHNNVKPYACRWPGCEYRCAHHSNINKHMKQVHHQSSMVVTIDDILDQLWNENKRLVDELLFANKLKIFLMKLFDKYKEIIDGEDKHEFKLLEEVLNCRIKLKSEEGNNTHIVVTKRNTRKQTVSPPILDDNKRKDDNKVTKKYKTNDLKVKKTKNVQNIVAKELKPWFRSNRYHCLNSDCQKTFTTIRNYKKHQKTCIVKCGLCHKKYRCQQSYVYHQMRAHDIKSEFMFKCDYDGCDYRSPKEYMLRKHMVKHSIDRPFVCNIDGCGKSFKTSHTLDIHRQIHSEQLYICNVDGCEKRFKHKSAHSRHLAEHKSEPTLCCPEKNCWQLFYSDIAIKRHRIDVHKRKFGISREKRYKRCDWPGCDYYGPSVMRHKIVHTGQKNYQCFWPQCDKRFAEKCKLDEHMNIHNNVKPFECRWPGCDYRSASHSNIWKHQKQVHQK
ncbi:zinc finger protein 91-like [Oppia nitens]|uniref:zinc finger protein 91-like n=1 Tax=Oppia nitens TaxID=1686743 RepID=UPI0023DB1F9B|nr:zinc finger protein 91-like [Oppia nitens]